jgi:hypothetical protein
MPNLTLGRISSGCGEPTSKPTQTKLGL